MTCLCSCVATCLWGAGWDGGRGGSCLVQMLWCWVGDGAAGTGCAVPWVLEEGDTGQTQAGTLGISHTWCSQSQLSSFHKVPKIWYCKKIWYMVIWPACWVNFQSTSVDMRVSLSLFHASFNLEIFCMDNIPDVLVHCFCLCFREQGKRALSWTYWSLQIKYLLWNLSFLQCGGARLTTE